MGTGWLGTDICNHGNTPEHKTRISGHVSHKVDSAGVECIGGRHKQTSCGDSRYDRSADDSWVRSACTGCLAKGHVPCSNDSTGPTTCVQCPRYLCVYSGPCDLRPLYLTIPCILRLDISGTACIFSI